MIYVFDLDGVLCKTEGRDYEGATPNYDRIAVVNKLYDEGHTILVDSARGTVMKIDWNEITKKQLEGWGLKFHQVRTGVKFYGDLYIDDKAVTDVAFFAEVK